MENSYQELPLITYLITLLLFCWIVAYGLAHLFQKQKQFAVWSKKKAKNAWNKHWKFFVGVAVGCLLMMKYV